MVDEVESAEWMAIISECMERGVFAWSPPPLPSFSKAASFSFGLSLFALRCFSLAFMSARAGPLRALLATRPCFRAPPSNPGR
jgi:hypothetical protein